MSYSIMNFKSLAVIGTIGVLSVVGAGQVLAVDPATLEETKEERLARREAVGLKDNVTISTVDGNAHLR